LADVLCFGGCLFDELRRDTSTLMQNAVDLEHVAEKMSAFSFYGTGTCYRGVAFSRLGQVQDGIVKMQEGLVVRRSVGAHCHSTSLLGSLAEGYLKAGDRESAWAVLTEALDMVEETGERYCAAELHRLRATILLTQGKEAEAEAGYRQATELAEKQGAKLWELRIATSYGRFLLQRGRADEAQRVLGTIYEWFSEGFDTLDLKEAKALLDEIESSTKN
jgi:predicted ATPase